MTRAAGRSGMTNLLDVSLADDYRSIAAWTYA
jgi:hypothetical protein